MENPLYFQDIYAVIMQATRSSVLLLLMCHFAVQQPRDALQSGISVEVALLKGRPMS